MRKLFFQVGNDFVEAGYEFTGFPSNGVWLVKDGSQNCIIPIEGIPEMPTPTLVSYMQYSGELMKCISNEWDNRALNTRDIAIIACEFFALKAGAIKLSDELIEG